MAVLLTVVVTVVAAGALVATGVDATGAEVAAGVTEEAPVVLLVVPPEGVENAAVLDTAAVVPVFRDTLQLWEMFFRLAVELLMSMF